jgi:hypothetical protein
MKLVQRLFASAGVCVATCAPAAALEIDQALSNADYQIQYFSPVAQSFNLSIDRIGAISVLAVDMNAFGDFLADRRITLALREGEGVLGSVLATSTVDAASALGGAYQSWITFNLAGVSIVPAAQYTFELMVTTPRFGVAAQQDDVYAGGRSYFTEAPSGQSFGAEFDLAFRIAAVDELPAPLLLLTGLAFGSAWRRCKGRVVGTTA